MSQRITSEELRSVIEDGKLPPSLPEAHLLALANPNPDSLAIAGVRTAIFYAAAQLQHSKTRVHVGGGERTVHPQDLSMLGRAILTEIAVNIRDNNMVRVELGLPNEV